jgi:hypothetical protein
VSCACRALRGYCPNLNASAETAIAPRSEPVAAKSRPTFQLSHMPSACLSFRNPSTEPHIALLPKVSRSERFASLHLSFEPSEGNSTAFQQCRGAEPQNHYHRKKNECENSPRHRHLIFRALYGRAHCQSCLLDGEAIACDGLASFDLLAGGGVTQQQDHRRPVEAPPIAKTGSEG